MREALRQTRRRRPDVFRRLIFHATGEAAPTLDGVGCVVFWLADPLREWYPICYEEAVRLASAARTRGLRVINPPETLSHSIKSTQAQLWRDAGIATPQVERFNDFAALTKAIERLTFPMFVRGDEYHAQRGARVFKSVDELVNADSKSILWPCAVSPLVDVRMGYRHDGGSPECAQLLHKKRLIVANGSIRTKHTFFSPDPIVSAETCIFNRQSWWSKIGLFPSLSALELKCIEHDLAYWRQGQEHRDVMLRACNVLGYDIVAIDYSNLADGSPILWEANPYFQLPSLREMMLPFQRNARERVDSYHDMIGDFLNGLPGECSSAENEYSVSISTAG
jgi:hypothetical protein